jgi:hypothetical protein
VLTFSAQYRPTRQKCSQGEGRILVTISFLLRVLAKELILISQPTQMRRSKSNGRSRGRSWHSDQRSDQAEVAIAPIAPLVLVQRGKLLAAVSPRNGMKGCPKMRSRRGPRARPPSRGEDDEVIPIDCGRIGYWS